MIVQAMSHLLQEIAALGAFNVVSQCHIQSVGILGMETIEAAPLVLLVAHQFARHVEIVDAACVLLRAKIVLRMKASAVLDGRDKGIVLSVMEHTVPPSCCKQGSNTAADGSHLSR